MNAPARHLYRFTLSERERAAQCWRDAIDSDLDTYLACIPSATTLSEELRRLENEIV